MPEPRIHLSDEVTAALAQHQPVVALESTIIAHGLPRPENLRVAHQIEEVVRQRGAIPATVGMVDGQLIVGLDDAALMRLASADGVAKLSVRDLAPAAAAGADGATTVASTSAVAASVGIAVFATGGLGGVHRGAAHSFDESADLTTLARTPIVVVCAGVKSILDLAATLERLETLGVAVVGYRSSRFAGFFVSDSGHDLDWRLDTPGQVAAAWIAHRAHDVSAAALVVSNPLPSEAQLDPELHDHVLAEALAIAERKGITGKDVTPALLAHFHAATGGASLAANIRIVLANAALAADIAVALREERP